MRGFIGVLIAILIFVIGYQLLKFFDQPSSDEDGKPILDNDDNLVYDGYSSCFGILLFVVCVFAGIGFILYAIISAIFGF